MQTRSRSTISLPKIKEVTQYEQKQHFIETVKKQKLLKQICKPKWGMVPKCLVKGHDGKDIVYVCINRNCQQSTRLICEQCFYQNHAKHNTQFLALDQVRNGNIQQLRYWPFDQQFKKMYQFIAKHQSYVNNLVQDINATFNVLNLQLTKEMTVRIVNQIDKMRLNMLKKIDTFYIKQTKKRQFALNLKQKLQQAFDLKRIQKVVSDLFNKKIRHSVFEGRMYQLLNDAQILSNQKKLLQFFDKSDKGLDIQFDKQLFLKKQGWMIKNINEQQQSLKSIQVVIGDQKQMKKIIPEALKYLETAIVGFKDLKFQKKVLEDSSQYVGFFHKNVKSIIGMRKYKSGFVYFGEWENDTRNGWGILENRKTGYRYVGQWKQDRKHGFGRQQSLVTIYEGQFFQDKKQGFGVLIKDGKRYEIAWKNDKMHGQGKIIESDGVQSPIYYINGNQTVTKNQKVSGSGAMSLTELAKKFSKSSTANTRTKAKSVISEVKST